VSATVAPAGESARNENSDMKIFTSYSNRHQTACFKVKTKPYNVATRTAGPSRVKAAHNSQRSKAGNAVVVTYLEPRGKEVKTFRVLETCNLVMATVIYSDCTLRSSDCLNACV
jgi:hypothetical protein